jgi:hypothetical protein
LWIYLGTTGTTMNFINLRPLNRKLIEFLKKATRMKRQDSEGEACYMGKTIELFQTKDLAG